MKVVVQVFAREPWPGACKRRLIPALGAAGAAALHARMVAATLSEACACGADAVELWSPAQGSTPLLDDLARRHQVTRHHQCGADLGERMLRAMDDARRRGLASVLLGCDCPALSAARMAEAVQALREGWPWVLRPTVDGGYVLVASAAPEPVVFSGLPWGGEQVMAGTRERLRAAGLRWLELEPVADVDRPADLVHVPAAWLADREPLPQGPSDPES